MPTEKQLAANRANAQKSTGPRTPEGKARSRWNALKHGLRAADLIPEPLRDRESPEEFQALHEALREELAPAGALAEHLVLTIAQCIWRLNRVIAAEANAIVEAREDCCEDLQSISHLIGKDLTSDLAKVPDRIRLPGAEQAARLLRYEAHLDRKLQRAYDLLERVQRRTPRKAPEPDPQGPPSNRTNRPPAPDPQDPSDTIVDKWGRVWSEKELRRMRDSLPPFLPNEPNSAVSPSPTVLPTKGGGGRGIGGNSAGAGGAAGPKGACAGGGVPPLPRWSGVGPTQRGGGGRGWGPDQPAKALSAKRTQFRRLPLSRAGAD